MKQIFEFTSGNVVGVVEAPDVLDPTRPLGEQYMVKIGVWDSRGDLPREDARRVIDELVAFVKPLINCNDEGGSDVVREESGYRDMPVVCDEPRGRGSRVRRWFYERISL